MDQKCLAFGVKWSKLHSVEEKGRNEAEMTAQGAVTTAVALALPDFSGNHTTKLEPNGRLILPSAFKGAFDGQARLRPQRDQYLMLWTDPVFNLIARDVQAKAGSTGAVRSLKLFKQSTASVQVDRQSRLVIPPALREQVGLGEQIVIAGAAETIEIWDAQRYEAEVRPSLDEADLYFDTFDGLSRDPE